ncbi:MAG: hypothetical protein Q8N96_00285 [Methylovulum sp.]|nr:hypothetical protein [Methylovulum sp.]
MKAKISPIILLSLVSSVLYGRYLLTSEPEAQPLENPQITKAISQPAKKPPTVITQKMDWNTPKPTDSFANPNIDDAGLHAKLNQRLTTLTPDEPIRLSNLSYIAQCPSCLQVLQDHLLAGNLSKQQLAQLANSLSRSNHPEFAAMLVDTIEKMLQQSANSKRGAVLMNALAKFNSAQIANTFVNYLASEREIPRPLQDALTNNINETSNRAQVAADLVKQFNGTDNAAMREKLLAIDHPEALAQISAQALEQNNTELYNQANEQLKSNPSKYALDALLALPQMQSADTDQVSQVVESAYQLANRQFSGNRLDYIEEKLALNAYSEQDKSLVLDILTHSEDPVRSAEIIAKYSTHP